jgi:TPR repeat protein
VEWYKKAAEHGNAKAQFNLAVMYAKAQGTSRDVVAAYQWLLVADSGGQGDQKLKSLLEQGLTPEERKEATQRAEKWLADHRE